jgi:hypothetical protein
MKIKQEWKPGVCEAMRCKEAATTVVPLAPFVAGLASLAARAVLETSRPTGLVAVCVRCQAKATIAFGDALAFTPDNDPWVQTPDLANPNGWRASDDAKRKLAIPAANAADAERRAAFRLDTHPPMTTVIPTASVESEIAANRAYALEQIEAVSLLEIETQDDYDLFAELLAEVKGKLKSITARKEEITKPMNAALKSARDLFRPAEVALGDAETAIKKVLGAFALRAETQRREAMEAAAAAHAQGDTAAVAVELSRIVTTENTSGLGVRKVWAFAVVDPDAVPRDLCSPDERKIRELVKTLGAPDGSEPEMIEGGVRYYVDTVVSSRSA